MMALRASVEIELSEKQSTFWNSHVGVDHEGTEHGT